jgi:clan AA aspartic protease (TIGR02281 family)
VEESVVFYQFTDNDGVVHFVDSPEKVPVRYRSRVVARTETPSARQTTRVLIGENRVHVPVTLTNGDRTVSALMLLDTGASRTILTEGLAARLGVGLADSRTATTRLADGRTVDIRVARIDGIAVGTRAKSSVEVGILQHLGDPELHDGLLGLDFLKEFQYQLDMANGFIRWQ